MAETIDTLSKYLVANKPKLMSALNDAIDFDRFAVVAMNTLRRTPDLAACHPSSVIEAINKCAELGLEAGGAMGLAYLVPFKSECQLVIGYRGYVNLLFRAGGLKDIQAHVVYENDKFNGAFGSEPHVDHQIGFAKRGKSIGAYCVMRYVNGGMHIEAMNMDELAKARALSRAKSGPWFDWTEEMYRKTVAKRGAKWGPFGGSPLMAKAEEYDSDTIDSVVIPAPEKPALASENGAAAAIDSTERVKSAIPMEPMTQQSPV